MRTQGVVGREVKKIALAHSSHDSSISQNSSLPYCVKKTMNNQQNNGSLQILILTLVEEGSYTVPCVMATFFCFAMFLGIQTL